ncbi:MAG: hypothetical protein WCY82_11690, partial [Desulfotomaculaceae bacterium]
MFKKRYNKILAYLMLIAMLCTIFPTAVLAAGEATTYSITKAPVPETVPTTYNVTTDSAITGGSLVLNPTGGTAGTTITVSVNPDTGMQLVEGSLKYTADSGATYTEITATEDIYSFILPAADAVVTAQFENIPVTPTVWDGSIDVTWYNDTDTSFCIDTPAKLAGLAAIVNGIYNEGATVTGNSDYIVCNVGGGAVPDSTSATWIYGADDFTGKTVKLTADLDMGGIYDSVGRTWSGPNYMPIGGQYCMTYEDGTTLIGSSWNGTFDGQGHTVKNIYCSRHAGSLGYAMSQSIGLIGRMGVHDNDPLEYYTNPSVKNVAVTGYIYGNRSIGGIVGKNGRSNGSVIENCINYASVNNTDSKGVGGIAGAGWNSLTIKNCANMGEIYTSYSNAGGIAGSCEAQVYNSYNIGYVSADNANQAQSLGTNNGGAVWTNCYWLDGSSTSNTAVYGSISGSTITKMDTSESMKTPEFLAALNGDNQGWVADTDNINDGYPIPAWQGTAFPKTYSITVDNTISGGTVTAEPTGGIEGTVVTVTVTPDLGKQPVTGSLKYTTDGGSTYMTITAIEGVYSFTLPAAAVTVTAQFEDLSSDLIISTREELLAFAAAVNSGDTFEGRTVTLGSNIALDGDGLYTTTDEYFQDGMPDYSGTFTVPAISAGANIWTPIGSSTNQFKGLFDGGGHTISGLYTDVNASCQGLFGYIGPGGSVKNVTVSGVVAGIQYVGGITGIINGGSIDNSVNRAVIYASGGAIPNGSGTHRLGHAGGIFGMGTGTADAPVSISGCANYGTVTASNCNQ